MTLAAPVGSDVEAARFLFDGCCEGVAFVVVGVVVVAAAAGVGREAEGDSSKVIETTVGSSGWGSGEWLVDNISSDDILSVFRGHVRKTQENPRRKIIETSCLEAGGPFLNGYIVDRRCFNSDVLSRGW